jgi:Niemann-Pick C1 protein
MDIPSPVPPQERFLGILPAVYVNVGAAFVACLLVTIFFLVSPVITLLVGLMVVCVDTYLFGLMALWSINLNETSVVTIVMACGFAVDYCSHVAHSFSISQGR